ncbi:MAG TPA: FAD-dependent oxidoreductase [Candidatus Saccharimonadales bacterium]|nr:FAD-dependent oxidoreductase [Candidatus Saccharimonadales bacterium]
MRNVDYLILGGGIAGTTAAEEIRRKDENSSITIITEEADRLYSRVLLPHFLRNENTPESLFVRPVDSYPQKNLELLTSTKITKVDTQNRQVTTDKEEFSYKKLLIATGGKVNRLQTPGAELPGVVYLRTLTDAKKIKEQMALSKNAIVIGGGFIGIEFAQSFIKNNLKTTSIVLEKSFWESVVGENSAKLLTQILTELGVTVLTESEVVEFSGEGKLQGVKLKNGQTLPADIAGVGVGIHMELSHLQDSGLMINKGVLTNEYLETSVPSVWAAGDIAEFKDLVTGKVHQLGNWSNASAQGRAVGINMAGERIAFQTTSMYSINIFESNFSFLGDPVVDEQTEVIERGDLAIKKLGRLLIRNDVIVGASLINLPLERNVLTNLIKNKTKITSSKAKLSDFSFDLSAIS